MPMFLTSSGTAAHGAAIVLLIATFGSVSMAETPSTEIDFARDVRPILSDKCNYCHGPDDANRQAGLRLDRREDAEYVLESGDLIDRITSDDPDMRMPPPESKLTLSDADVDTLRRWIDQGAPYAKHWSFQPLPGTVDVPAVQDDDWSRNPIDRFVVARLEKAGLSPADPASHTRWLRRVTFDLTGLPPTADQIARFIEACKHDADAAYRDAVDRLLQSRSFGEHMAIGWLDLARYADSYGYQSDKLNTQWPYRDWVVRAFNENLPYDDFLTWQLAGDLLENPTTDQRLATAFNRIHRLNNEGGAVFEEWRVENVADRVHTFGTAVLGLTMECCRCHDHKYDPLPMRDYYALSAFFNSIDESGVYDRTAKVPCPSMLLPTEEQAVALEQAKRDADQRLEEYRRLVEQARDRPTQKKQGITPPAELPDLKVALSFDRDFDNSMKEIYHPSENDRGWTSMPDLVAVEGSEIPTLPESQAADLADYKGETTRRALSLDGQRGVTVHGVDPLDRWTPFSVVVTLRETERSPLRSLIVHHTRGTDCGYNGWDLTIVDGHVESRMYRVWPGNAIGVRTVDPIPADVWHQLSATYDGSSDAEGLRLYLNGVPLPTRVLRNDIKKSSNVKVDHGGEFVVGQRFRARGLTGGLIDDVRLYQRQLTAPELGYLATGRWEGDLADVYVSALDSECRDAMGRLTKARQAVVMAEEAMNEIPIMQEWDTPRETHLLARGQYDAPTDDSTRVQRDVPTAIELPWFDQWPQDRLGLARWVTHPNHPLTARVAVNHLWSRFFSAPLVRTPENFGLQGELPTHPELLDWLARDFVDNGWDVQRLCRQIVLSATYCQDSVPGEKTIEVDPENRLLSRGPAHRYSGEQIRDLALAASGLMDRQLGGPPVSPYQPGKDLWKESNGMSPPYQQSVGESLYRRSLYSVWKRTVPLPNMMAFDATTREVCTVVRSRTNTPLQALVLLNDVQFVEASRVLAQDVLGAEDSGDAVAAAFLRLAGRDADQEELQLLMTLLDDERRHYADHPKAAEQLISIGDSAVDATADPIELAAMTTVCQAILNLDATIWKR
ncbi:Planctomycete cytochrome C [Crateriforma conspicua]|uniref:Planctomycete cytochrome C n=2 Tax=Crateriforma conspicua TaxID=2527996 RepID=A0A5C5Y2P7_9PLAN|nr:Planctomycete cytochrome C [Crateriforma conspicua]